MPPSQRKTRCASGATRAWHAARLRRAESRQLEVDEPGDSDKQPLATSHLMLDAGLRAQA